MISSNLMEGVRHALMVNRLHYGSAAAVTHLDALRWATEGSARCLGRDDIGRIAPGKQADLALFSLDELRFRAATIRWRRWCCAARIGPTACWSPAVAGGRSSVGLDLPNARLHGNAARAFV
jgi:cytosine/adenosine deaminase-related metal-dependent hydrolase